MSIAFERASKTFFDFLKKQGKTHNTLRNYKSDLASLENFLEKHKLNFLKLSLMNFENYHQWLIAKGLKPNSRRRKLMTTKTFLRYMSTRIDLSTVGSERIVPPEKVEKPPKLVPLNVIYSLIDEQPAHVLGIRNQALLFVLLETGALVTEVLSLRREDCRLFKNPQKGATLFFQGKRARQTTVGSQVALALKKLLDNFNEHQKYIFYGYSKNGPNAEKLTPRGVEMLFAGWALKYKLKHLKPRQMRHLYIMQQLLLGKKETEIMSQLGLSTPYIFKIYKPLLASKSNSEASSKGSNIFDKSQKAEPARLK